MKPTWHRLALAVTVPAVLATCSTAQERDETTVAPEPGAPRAFAAMAVGALPMVTGCAPGARCLSVTQRGQPDATGDYVAQCRGRYADFIVPKATIPAGYAGPWFTPQLLENASTGVPQGTRPWTSIDPRQASQRMAYVLALRNYAFSSTVVHGLTPQITGDDGYLDPTGGAVRTALRDQRWYPAPRMFYGATNQPGTREAAYGMTLERTVLRNELGGNTEPFRNYAVAYYDARGGRAFRNAWDSSKPGVDTPRLGNLRMPEGTLVFKLLYSAATPVMFPQDLLDGSLALEVLSNPSAPAVPVRLLQIDIAVKDQRAGATGWYFATYAYDRSLPGSSPWRKMVPVGLMWGNDPDGLPITESWINPDAPAYARAHLGVDDRLNGPVDNRASACMSCHSTAQAPSVARMFPSGTCAPQRAQWFRNLAGTQAFGRFDPQPQGCETAPPSVPLTAADYSLQLSATVARALPTGGARTFNPCTWDENNPPTVTGAVGALQPADFTQFPVSRDPEQFDGQ